jgi:hypothetical protein
MYQYIYIYIYIYMNIHMYVVYIQKYTQRCIIIKYTIFIIGVHILSAYVHINEHSDIVIINMPVYNIYM